MSVGTALRRMVQRAVDLWNVPAAWTTVHRANVADFAHDGRTARIEGWEKHPVVHACIRAVVDIVKAVPLEVYTGQGDDEEVIDNHPLTELLRNPMPNAPNMPGSRFIGLTAQHYMLYGNALWDIKRSGRSNRGPAGGLKLIHPEHLQSAEYSEDEDRIIWYDWSVQETGSLKRSKAEDVVHFADLSGESWLFGYPRIAAALQDIIADKEASRYVRQIVTNDGGSMLAFMMGDGTTREQAETAEAYWHEKRIKRGERGRTAFVPGTAKVENIGFNLQQLEFPDLRRVTREDICAACGVDPRMIGVASAGSDGGLSGVQYREARVRLIQHTVAPLMFDLENHINHWLAPEYGEVRVRFSPNGLSELTEDETETSARAVSEYGASIRTLEESRVMLGLPAERDKTHHIKAGLMGELKVSDVETLALPTAQAAIAPPEPDEEKEPQRALPPVSRVGLTPEQRTNKWLAFDRLARLHEAQIESTARSLFVADAERVAKLFRVVRAEPDPVLTPHEVEFLLRELRRIFGGEGPSVTQWSDQMSGPIGTAVRQGATGLSFPVTNPRLPKVISQRADRLGQHVGHTTAAQIEAAILAGQQAQWGVRQTAQMVNQTVFGGIAAQRSTMIARTESIGSLNEGAYVAAAESGVINEVEWLTQQDDRVRDTHAAQDGVRLPLGRTFPNGCRFPGDPSADPNEIIQCRCTLLFY